jgi:hypothetical protein
MTETDVSWITAKAASGFGSHTDADEFLHGTGPAGDSLTETWYWGFNVPEAKINCFAYCWVHPNLGVVSSGLMIYQGIKHRHLAAELFDYHTYLSMQAVGDGGDIRVPGGMRVQVIEPLRRSRMTFADPTRETELEILMTAVGEPIMRANSKHFEQIMHTTGSLRLRGTRYRVDSHTVRDRSWGELRPEGNVPAPPYTWVTGVFDDGAIGFTVGALDNPGEVPQRIGGVNVSEADNVTDAWLRRDGRNLRIVKVHRRTEREIETLRPVRHFLDMEDSEGRRHRASGEIVASMPHSGWHNMNCHIALVRWEMNGSVGWGESQDCQWNDYVWRYGQIEA